MNLTSPLKEHILNPPKIFTDLQTDNLLIVRLNQLNKELDSLHNIANLLHGSCSHQINLDLYFIKSYENLEPVRALKCENFALLDSSQDPVIQELASTESKRRYFQLAVVNAHEFHVIGGEAYQAQGWFKNEDWVITAMTEIYNTANDSWTMGPSLRAARKNHSCCSLEQKLYVFGGTDKNNTTLGSIEILEPAKSKDW